MRLAAGRNVELPAAARGADVLRLATVPFSRNVWLVDGALLASVGAVERISMPGTGRWVLANPKSRSTASLSDNVGRESVVLPQAHIIWLKRPKQT